MLEIGYDSAEFVAFSQLAIKTNVKRTRTGLIKNNLITARIYGEPLTCQPAKVLRVNS